jgi:hypothetical protein
MISEMSLALMNGLSEGEGILDLDLVLRYYRDWIGSCKPMLGMATYNALALEKYQGDISIEKIFK